ncbi:4'-phosphopantetheinyl transferase family protein [Actinoplanes sp. G11-F43]|uniref:4'-phosphopantetheinyl transferase family protein n=1 Tax=Actinoplanes sp. G11-F43 TaxID=3424130 RepID=UPI003D34A7C6
MLLLGDGPLERLLPDPVQVREVFGDLDGVELFPEEQAVIARAVDKRRREFATVRSCAREALAGLGVPAVPIVPGPRGAPGWPDGVVGSMTHCDGYRAAAVAPASRVRTIGVDAEPAGPLPDGVLAAIALPEELTAVAALTAADPGVAWDRLLFCAKEAVYKAWFPLTGEWLDFSEARITLGAGTFAARLLVPGPVTPEGTLSGFTGTWLHHRGLLVCAIVVPVPA